LPVPVRLEVCGLLLAPSFTLKIPVLVPVCVGVSTTLMVQCAAAATLVPQVVAETLKSPLAEIETLNGTFRWLVKVNTFAGLVVPLTRAGYVALTGVNVACAPPVPDSGTVCGLFEPLS
jgi:hypothetical protein